jgi:hypothetical protein
MVRSAKELADITQLVHGHQVPSDVKILETGSRRVTTAQPAAQEESVAASQQAQNFTGTDLPALLVFRNAWGPLVAVVAQPTPRQHRSQGIGEQ